MTVSQTQLKELLDYNPETGLFVWKVRRGGIACKGTVAGSTDSHGYTQISINKRHHLAHRLAYLYMTGEFPSEAMDHINGIRGDNRWCNLRSCTPEENCKNIANRKDNTSGQIGVSWREDSQKWRVRITFDGKRKHLGAFDNKFDAVAVRKSAELRYGYHPNHGR